MYCRAFNVMLDWRIPSNFKIFLQLMNRNKGEPYKHRTRSDDPSSTEEVSSKKSRTTSIIKKRSFNTLSGKYLVNLINLSELNWHIILSSYNRNTILEVKWIFCRLISIRGCHKVGVLEVKLKLIILPTICRSTFFV